MSWMPQPRSGRITRSPRAVPRMMRIVRRHHLIAPERTHDDRVIDVAVFQPDHDLVAHFRHEVAPPSSFQRFMRGHEPAPTLDDENSSPNVLNVRAGSSVTSSRHPAQGSVLPAENAARAPIGTSRTNGKWRSTAGEAMIVDPWSLSPGSRLSARIERSRASRFRSAVGVPYSRPHGPGWTRSAAASRLGS